MGHPLSSKNKVRSELQDLPKPRPPKHGSPTHLRATEEEYPATFEDDLNERDRFTYVPRTCDTRRVTLLPSDVAPRPRRYTILDRIENENLVPEYLLREDVASTSSHSDTRDPPDPRLTLAHDGLVKTYTTVLPHTPSPISDYDPDDPSLLRISLLYIDNFVSPRQIEAYENTRFANPKPEDDPFAYRCLDTSSRSSGSRERSLAVLQEEIWENNPVGRPPKRRRLREAVFISNAIKRSLSQSSISDSEPSDGLSAGGMQEGRQNDVEGDVDMVASVEQDALNSIPESDVEDTLQAFVSNKPLEPSPAPRLSLRSIPTISSRSSIASPPSSKSLTPFEHLSGHPQSVNPDKEIRSPTPSQVSAQWSIPPLTSQSIVPSIYSVPPSKLQPSALRVELPNRRKSIPTNQPLRPEAATADMARQLIKEQFPSLAQKSKSRFEPSSPKRVSKLNTPSIRPVSSLQSGQNPKSIPNFTQTKLSFAKASPKPKFPLPEPKSPVNKTLDLPPLQAAEEREGQEFEVSHILGHDDSAGMRFYQVAWVGYSHEQATWLSEEELGGAKKALKQYKKKLKIGQGK
jgi:hypothetical protein